MTTKQTKRMMLAGAAWVLICAAGVLVWGVLSPAVVAVPEATTRGAGGSDGAAPDRSAEQGPTLDDLKVLAGLDLRQPLKDPPPQVAAPKVLMAKLMGTVYDPARPERSMAWFKMADGSDHWLKIGAQFNDQAGQVTVKSIGQDKATVDIDGAERGLVASSP